MESQKLLRNIEEFSVGVSTLKGQLVGDIKVGLVDAIATDKNLRLEQAFAEFLSEPNDIRFEVSQNTPQELQQRILNGNLDVGIGSFSYKAAGLNYQPLHSEVHSLYCGAAHPLFSEKQSDMSIDSLRKESIVGRGYWRDRHHEELGFVNVKAVVYEIEPQLILIRSGKFIGYLPDHFAEQWVLSGQLRCLSPLAARFDCEFDLVSKKGYKPSQALSKFVAAVLAQAII